MMTTRVLTPAQATRIHAASLAILERTGVEIPHPEVRIRFADSGARVEGDRVRIPPDLIERLLAGAGRSFILQGRDLSRTAVFGGGRRNYNSTAGQASWVDFPGAPRRYPTLADVAVAARFADALDGIGVVGAMADPHDRPAACRCVEVMAELVRNTTKPVMFWFHDRASARFLVDMMIALRGSAKAAEAAPLCYPFLEPISPLRFPFHGVDLLFETARLNLPVPVGPMAQMGLSAPGTRAGTMVQENAEILAGICITQLIRTGMPVCYGGVCHAFDMSRTQVVFGGPEQALFGVAMTQMGKRYGLPVYVNSGLTDSKRPDAQAGAEIGMTLMLAAAAGADIFGHLGICGADQGASLETLLLQNEIIGYVEHVMSGPDLRDEALGVAEVEAVGPGGTFIDREYTADRLRTESWFPGLFDRQYYQPWLEAGGADLQMRLVARKEEILRTHRPEPLSAEAERAVAGILRDAQRHLG
jgi:trimethylamine--corrinoid protein Co-methyltransferase